MTEEELASWRRAFEKYDLKFRVLQPKQVALSDRDLFLDADVVLRVQYIDRATREPTTTNDLPRHAQLSKQRQRWQLEVFK